jgi:hypothetical protein
VSRDLSRVLRWRHASFRRRRFPYLFEQWVTFPFNRLTFPIRMPLTWWHVRRIRLAIAQGETVIEA